jgi:hypothetical protein
MGLLSFLNRPPALVPGEKVRWSHPCLYSLERSTVGGTLVLTQNALIFTPNRISGHPDRAERINLSNIVSVDVQAPTGTPYNGGMKERIRIKTRGGRTHLLHTKRPAETAAELRRLVSDR